MAEPDYDVVIVGGGLVGASLAVGLAASDLRVAMVEAVAPRQGEPSWDERCIALNHASHGILQALGVWPELADEAAPILSTHISERGRFGVARFSAAEAGLEALGYNIPIRALGQRLWQRMLDTGRTTLRCPARVTGLRPSDDRVELDLDDGSVLSGRLIVAADGADSPVRHLLGVDAERRDYEQSAIVTAVKVSRPHRGCAYERFTDEGPIALLPKYPQGGDRICSLVWTTPAARVQSRLNDSDAAFIAQAEDAFGERLGRFLELGARNAWQLARVMSDQLSAPRVIFAGNAAQALHPVAAQGFNLGLRDVATLAEVLLQRMPDDAGGADVISDYVGRRQRDRARVADFTDHLVRLFSNRIPGLRGLRHLGLLALDLAPGLREAVMWQNLGFGGQAPAMARSGR
ncbi:MAG: 2-octaprenyl-6-methoxyphenyl hydroxylase [Nevskiales bacterium]|nr:2-octaprenyl-6-methoxyphenyl hydroxylase [Nevskiales bacterium]